MKRFIIAALFLSATLGLAAQTPAPAQPQAGTKGTPVLPAQIDVNGTKVGGDIVVLADLGELTAILAAYNAEETRLQDKFNPSWKQTQAKIQADIAAVKKANNWSDDVNFDPETKTWYRSNKTAPTPPAPAQALPAPAPAPAPTPATKK